MESIEFCVFSRYIVYYSSAYSIGLIQQGLVYFLGVNLESLNGSVEQRGIDQKDTQSSHLFTDVAWIREAHQWVISTSLLYCLCTNKISMTFQRGNMPKVQ